MAITRSLQKKFILQVSLAGGIIFLLVIAHVFVVFDIKRRNKNIQEMRSEAAFNQQATRSFVLLTEQEKQANKYSDFLNNILPARDDLIHFNQVLRDLASNYDASVGFVFGVESPSTETSPGSTSFRLTIDAPADKFSDFIEAFDTISYLVAFDSIEYSRLDGGFVRVQISGRVFTK